MGVLPAVNLSSLIALDVAGLTQALQQILETVQDQQNTLEYQKQALQTQSERLNAIEGMFGCREDCGDGVETSGILEPLQVAEADAIATADAQAASGTATPGSRSPEFGRSGHHTSAFGAVSSAIAGVSALETSVEALAKRLALSEQHHTDAIRSFSLAEQSQADLVKQLAEERGSRESLEKSIASLQEAFRNQEAKSVESNKGFEDLRRDLSEELRRSYQQFEARVRVAEEKASACRQEAKDFRGSEDGREYAISEVQSQLRRVQQQAGQSQVVEAHSPISQSANFEAQIQELADMLRAKASESVVEAIRDDLEMSSQVLKDAVKAMGKRVSDISFVLSEQEERLRSVESKPIRRTLIQDTEPNSNWSLPPTSEEKAHSQGDDSTHCLMCSNDRSLSPTRAIVGIDYNVYGHMDASAEYGEPQLLSTLRGSPSTLQNVVRPRPTPASIPRSQNASHARLHPEVGANTAAAVSPVQKLPLRPGRDVKSKKLSDLVAVDSVSTANKKTLSRPSSAQQRPARPVSAGTVRPSSAGVIRSTSTAALGAAGESTSIAVAAAETQVLLASQSLPILERGEHGPTRS